MFPAYLGMQLRLAITDLLRDGLTTSLVQAISHLRLRLREDLLAMVRPWYSSPLCSWRGLELDDKGLEIAPGLLTRAWPNR